ncbi:hypothetical protein SODALDRAFT_115955 [Sodiomyces alkalinus F11]|uniref:Uncharacterized protein n=1 Tax=Sodiomyces alkalinus (strain CBS 110278 / VKM F-3762 / F11) TaxID=1314773 RepID=A0A3N2Q3J1_SODAK|nr:hypothetical protein SODALDRAFT_115955 [Sodiomyces alkalinus F11]ROT41286.1 hypothetical protein SODALDRAFT_115955 [Sodiomyces alkalinus F11]
MEKVEKMPATCRQPLSFSLSLFSSAFFFSFSSYVLVPSHPASPLIPPDSYHYIAGGTSSGAWAWLVWPWTSSSNLNYVWWMKMGGRIRCSGSQWTRPGSIQRHGSPVRGRIPVRKQGERRKGGKEVKRKGGKGARGAEERVDCFGQVCDRSLSRKCIYLMQIGMCSSTVLISYGWEMRIGVYHRGGVTYLCQYILLPLSTLCTPLGPFTDTKVPNGFELVCTVCTMYKTYV